jgi:hypothetical protein
MRLVDRLIEHLQQPFHNSAEALSRLALAPSKGLPAVAGGAYLRVDGN